VTVLANRTQFAFGLTREHIPAMRQALLAIALFLPAMASACSRPDDVDPACFNRTSEKVGGPFALTSHQGVRVTEESFRGRKTLVFFGFTHCPDVCPQTLYSVGTAMRLLPKNVKPPHTVLISIDPARDTPEALSTYITSNGFPTDITGLTGTFEELDQVSKAFAAPFQRVEDSDSASGYQMEHSSILYLMDENWKLKTFFTPDTRPETIAKCIAALS
jgi:protein SCO1/2